MANNRCWKTKEHRRDDRRLGREDVVAPFSATDDWTIAPRIQYSTIDHLFYDEIPPTNSTVAAARSVPRDGLPYRSMMDAVFRRCPPNGPPPSASFRECPDDGNQEETRFRAAGGGADRESIRSSARFSLLATIDAALTLTFTTTARAEHEK